MTSARRTLVSRSSVRSSHSAACFQFTNAIIHACASSADSAQKSAARLAAPDEKRPPERLERPSAGERWKAWAPMAATSFSAGGGSSGATLRSSKQTAATAFAGELQSFSAKSSTKLWQQTA